MSVLLDQIKGISWYSWFISDKSVRGAPTVFDTVDHNTGIKSWEIEKWIKSLNMTSKSGHEVNPASWIRRKCPINVRYYGNWPIQRISTQFVSALHLEPIKKEIWLVLFWQIFILQITHRIGRWTGAKIIFRLGHGPFEGILELKTPRKWPKSYFKIAQNGTVTVKIALCKCCLKRKKIKITFKSLKSASQSRSIRAVENELWN